jgi:hypothetical protein
MMFGLELQTSGNVFVNGVADREVAYRHESGLMTLEGDETTNSGASSELEFVTAPCASLSQAQQAVGHAADLAAELARQAAKAGPVLAFKAGEKLLGGTWLRDCQIRVGDPKFIANPQGTVGIPLAKMRAFIEEVLNDLGAEGETFLKDLETMRQGSGLDFTSDEDADLTGFLTACHLFLLLASWSNVAAVAVDENGCPLKKFAGQELLYLDPRFFRAFTFPDSPYLRSFELADGVPAFQKKDGSCRVIVCRDSPKSGFKVLHRTDFYAMCHALPGAQLERLRKLPVREDGVPVAVWPSEWPDRELLTFPYRADPVDPAAAQAGQVRQYPVEGWPGGEVTKAEHWALAEHGPKLSEWWHSVVNGRPVPGQKILVPKDLASPPPGFQGRSPEKLGSFPKEDENKRAYYGMGAFPMDSNDGKVPLAVYEHRAFADSPAVTKLGELSSDRWGSIVAVFHEQFVAPFA